MPSSFSVNAPVRIEFGNGALGLLPDMVHSLPATRAFVVTDPGIRACGVLDQVLGTLRDAGIENDVFDEVEPNPSLATLDRASARVRSFGDCAVVALGGGSSMDAGKGIALGAVNTGPVADLDFGSGTASPGLPIIAIPTTAGTGAETNGFGVIEDTGAHCKVYVGDASVTPRVSILDPMLTRGLPPAVTASTGVDALVHAVESLMSKGSNELSEAYAHRAASLIMANLRQAVAHGDDMDARAGMLLGAHLAGLALSISGLGLVHGIAHSVTAHTGTAHGVALSSVFGDVLDFNLPDSEAELGQIAFDIGVGSTVRSVVENAQATVAAIRKLVVDVGTYRPLRELGCSKPMLPAIVDATLADAVTRNTPRMPTRQQLHELLMAAL